MARTHLERRCALLEKLAELTPKMRHAQRNYFKESNKSMKQQYLRESIEHENKVDRTLEELAVNRGYLKAELPGQAGLFD